MLKIAVVDDDAKDADVIKKYIERYGRENARTPGKEDREIGVTVFGSAEDFLAGVPSGFDAVFFDIDMPGMNGMDAAKLLRGQGGDLAIIFVTNMARYAIDGYSVQALDFIVKPVAYYDFALKFAKVTEYCARRTSRRLNLRIGESEQVSVDSADVTYIEIMQHYLIYHTAGGKTYRVRGTMEDAEKRLSPYAFVRASKSYLVNLRHVASVKGNEVTAGGETIYIGRTTRETFLKRYGKYIGGLKL